jgi:hypothetical protein
LFILVGGGAGVFALSSSLRQPIIRTSTSSVPPDTQMLDEPTTTTAGAVNDPLVTAAPTTDEPAPTEVTEPEPTPPAGDAQPVTTPAVAPPPTATATSTPALAPAPAPAPTTSLAPIPAYKEVPMNSKCGIVVVGVAGTRLRIVSIEPAPGFGSRVADGGPESIEVSFTAGGQTCELHAESTPTGLSIEVQNPSED